MSKQESNSNKSVGLVDSFLNPPSRITRTSANTQPSSRLTYNSSLLPPTLPEMPKQEVPLGKAPSTDKIVRSQEATKKKQTNMPTNTSTVNNSISNPNSIEDQKAMGFISNAFLGTTTKFMKSSLLPAFTPSITTAKNDEEPVEDRKDSNSKGTLAAKFSRNKEATEGKPRTTSFKQSPIAPYQALESDRSQVQVSKKIERKPVSRELKFSEKKEEKVEVIADKPTTSTPPPKGKTESFKVDPVMAPVKAQTVQSKPLQLPKLNQQPIQRNPYSRSRLLTEAPKQSTPAKEQPQNEEVKVQPVSRLVPSRLQSNIPQPTKPQKEVVPGRVSQSRLMEGDKAETKPQQTKPRPNARSLVAKKTEPQPIVQPTSQIANTQPQFNQSKSSVSQNSGNKSNINQSVVLKSSEQAKDSAVALKKSSCVGLIGKRLVRSRLQDCFSVMKSHKQSQKLKYVNQCNILTCSMANIVKIKETNLLKLGFQALKKKFAALYIASLKSFAEPTIINYKNTGIVLIDRIFSSKMRSVLTTLKNSFQNTKKKSKCLFCIEIFASKLLSSNIKHSFEAIRMKEKIFTHKLGQLSDILNKFNRNKVAIAFSKFLSIRPVIVNVQQMSYRHQKIKLSPKIQQTSQIIDTSNPTLIEKIQKLKKNIASTNQEISTLQTSLQKKKKEKGPDAEKGNLQEKIIILKQQNEQINTEIQIKKHRNEQIQAQIKTIPLKANILLQEEEVWDSRLSFLTNIYISNFKNPEETVSCSQIISQYSLKAQDSAVLFNEWESILRNVELKRVIGWYEGVGGRENKGRVSLMGEQSLISKLIKSYVKEQYFWNWIHISAQNI